MFKTFCTSVFTEEDRLILYTLEFHNLEKLRNRWSNLTPRGSGALGEKYITNGQFSSWSSRVKKVCKKKKKIVQIKPRKYLSSLKTELSGKVTGRGVTADTARGIAKCLLHFIF